MTTENKAPLPDEVEKCLIELETFANKQMEREFLTTGGSSFAGWMPTSSEFAETIRAHIAALEADNQRLREALEWIKANWDNQDMQHTEYRVKAFVEAKMALHNQDAVCHVCGGGGHSLISDCGCKSCNGTGKAALAQHGKDE